jgi:hypothetical protein
LNKVWVFGEKIRIEGVGLKIISKEKYELKLEFIENSF